MSETDSHSKPRCMDLGQDDEKELDIRIKSIIVLCHKESSESREKKEASYRRRSKKKQKASRSNIGQVSSYDKEKDRSESGSKAKRNQEQDTHKGKKVNLVNINKSDLNIEDIYSIKNPMIQTLNGEEKEQGKGLLVSRKESVTEELGEDRIESLENSLLFEADSVTAEGDGQLEEESHRKQGQKQVLVERNNTPIQEMCVRTSKFWQTPAAIVSSPFTPTDKQKEKNTKGVDSTLVEEVQNFLNKDMRLDFTFDNVTVEYEELEILSEELLQVFSWIILIIAQRARRRN